jgi:hypothetical protein
LPAFVGVQTKSAVHTNDWYVTALVRSQMTDVIWLGLIVSQKAMNVKRDIYSLYYFTSDKTLSRAILLTPVVKNTEGALA